MQERVMGKHRWKGELATPIRPKVERPLNLCRITNKTAAAAANKEMLKLYEQAVKKEWIKKLHLLMDKYKIADKSDFCSLSLELALELDIPGFRVDAPYFNSDAMPFRLMPVTLEGPNKEPLDGYLVAQDEREKGRRRYWTEKRLRDLGRAVDEEKKKRQLSKDIDALAATRTPARMVPTSPSQRHPSAVA